MKKLIVFFLAIQIISTQQLHSQKTKTQPAIAQKYVVVDGHKMHYQTAGSGNPAVVFEGGVTDDFTSWTPVFSETSKFTRVVSYDRMGLGASDTATTPRSFKQIATELHSMLHNANILPPYILVGHSMAGATLRAFAHLYKSELAGMVFIDCMTEYDINGVPKDTLESHLPPEVFARQSTPQESELYLLRTEVLSGFREIKSFDPLPDIPVHVFVGQKNIYPEINHNRSEWYEKFVSNLTETSLTILPASSHYIQRDYPGLIVSAIQQMLHPDPDRMLKAILLEKGIDSCIVEYKKIKSSYSAGVITEGTLNKLGYDAMNRGDLTGSVKLFLLNTAMYPNSFNVYDSLGEAYMKLKNKKEAIRNYSKSLELNSTNRNAINMLSKLKTIK